MDLFQTYVVDPLNGALWGWLLIYLLLGVGLYFTIRTRAVQVRLFRTMWQNVRGAGRADNGGISSFQAFAVGLASRVGTGNIAGVAIALALGGPGALFWMWMVALVGMATGFVEATLAQMYKERSPDGTFRGGPAYYIQKGLGSRAGGVVFAVLLIGTFGVAFNMVQANTIAGVMEGAHAVSTGWTAVALMALVAPVLFGGVKRIAKVAGRLLPLMAAVYVGLALVIVVLNVDFLPEMLRQIVAGAFGLDSTLAGIGGGILAAMLNGTKRGLFSNEAGMGSAPNAAATATTSHPAKQGLIQSLGVFVDTMVISTATAFIILSSGVFTPGVTQADAGATLTQAAVASQLGTWTTGLMTLLIFFFAYSSLIGNYSYAEVNLDYLGAKERTKTLFRLVVIASVGLGSVFALTTVWDIADLAMAMMALVNLVAILLLGKWALGALADYEASRRAGRDPVFVAAHSEWMPGHLDTDIWTAEGAHEHPVQAEQVTT